MQNVSIIIPFFEKGEALLKTINELILQIHPDDDIVIVDDNSPSGVPDCECPTARIIQLKKRTPHIYRLCTLRNRGIQEAKHDAVIILDPDCIPNPHFLPNARKIFDSSVLFGGAIDKLQQDGTIKLDPRRKGGSRWIDLNERDAQGGQIWGGIMMFSKARTALSGWFSEDFNGAWGAEEHEFASRCFHAGLRLRYELSLQILHQWHPKKTEGNQRNIKLWQEKVMSYPDHLNRLSPYRPAVGVMVITLLRPELLDQCLRSVFRNKIPLKVRLIANGDDGDNTRKITQQWGNRWAVDLISHERKWPAEIRNETMKWATKRGFRYLIFIDDDIVVLPDAITNLVRTMENNPDLYACSGYLKRTRGNDEHMLGGPREGGTFYYHAKKVGFQESDWVGGGLTIHRLKALIPYDENYQTGYNDYDWSMKVTQEHGLKLGVTGDAGAYHGILFTPKGIQRYRNPRKYNAIRYDSERHKRMRDLFKEKWGYDIKAEGIWQKN